MLWSSTWERGGQIRGCLGGECDLGMEGEDHGHAWACYESGWCWEHDEVGEERRVEASLGAGQTGVWVGVEGLKVGERATAER